MSDNDWSRTTYFGAPLHCTKELLDTISGPRWWYRDPEGTARGPFDNATMTSWVKAGWFDSSIMVAPNNSGIFNDICSEPALAKHMPRGSCPESVYPTQRTKRFRDESSHQENEPSTVIPDSKRSKRALRKQLHQAIQKSPPIFHTKQSAEYSKTLKDSYSKIAVLPRSSVSEIDHEAFHSALATLHSAGYFTRQVVSLMDNRWTVLRFTRLLIGQAGMTYMYNGVRDFAHPWQDQVPLSNSILDSLQFDVSTPFKISREYPQNIKFALHQVHEMNTLLETRASIFCKERGIRVNDDTNSFNITVTNLMEPTATVPEPYYGMGPQAVGWHRDLRLAPKSSIGVYSCHTNCSSDDLKHVLNAQSDGKPKVLPATNDLWKIGLKIAWNIEVPGLVVELENGDSYFMLEDCNTINQHCVLAGGCNRFSSTHRNGQTERMTWDGIYKEYVDSVSDGSHTQTSSWVVAIAEIHMIVEDSWIRQFWVKGEAHAKSHAYWVERIIVLESMWIDVETKITKEINRIIYMEDVHSANAIVDGLVARARMREMWTERYNVAEYEMLQKIDRPIKRPDFLAAGIPENLSEKCEQLRRLISANTL